MLKKPARDLKWNFIFLNASRKAFVAKETVSMSSAIKSSYLPDSKFPKKWKLSHTYTSQCTNSLGAGVNSHLCVCMELHIPGTVKKWPNMEGDQAKMLAATKQLSDVAALE